MKKMAGFNMIELLVFIIIVGLFSNVGLLAIRTISTNTPVAHQALVAMQSARQCIEWYAGQRAVNGYSSISCPSSTVPAFCTVPSGYTIATNVTCTTINGDANYQTIVVTVGGKGNASLTLLIAA